MGDTAKMTCQSSAADAKRTTTRKKSAKKKAAAKKTPARKRATKKKAAAKKTPARKRATKKKATAKKAPARRQVAPKGAIHSLTPQTKGGGAERRVDERHDLSSLLQVDIEVFGYQRDGREFGIGPAPGAARKIHGFGRTVNLSINGMLARVADMVTEGSNCLVRFVNTGAGVRPELRWGLVLRCDELESGKYELAVRFDSPLEHLDVDTLDGA